MSHETKALVDDLRDRLAAGRSVSDTPGGTQKADPTPDSNLIGN